MRPYLLIIAAAAVGCAPKALPLRGVPAPTSAIPRAMLAPGYRRLTFHWEYRDRDVSVKGDGAARIAPPDSARLDFVVSGGLGSGHALLLGDTVVAPGRDLVRRTLPPPPLVWAALGRLAVPPARDTLVRVDGDTIEAEIGDSSTVAAEEAGGGGAATGKNKVMYRVVFAGTRLVSMERVSGGRVREVVTRLPDDEVVFHNPADRRTLKLMQVRSETVDEFDSQVWKR
jgi:hypothetical protein